MLEVRGDSMADAGIEPGDLVLCRQQDLPDGGRGQVGDIVLAARLGEQRFTE